MAFMCSTIHRNYYYRGHHQRIKEIISSLAPLLCSAPVLMRRMVVYITDSCHMRGVCIMKGDIVVGTGGGGARAIGDVIICLCWIMIRRKEDRAAAADGERCSSVSHPKTRSRRVDSTPLPQCLLSRSSCCGGWLKWFSITIAVKWEFSSNCNHNKFTTERAACNQILLRHRVCGWADEWWWWWWKGGDCWSIWLGWTRNIVNNYWRFNVKYFW